MLNKTKVALAAALIIGTASLGATSALASDNSGEYSGGSKIGPLGQHFGAVRGPAYGFAYAPGSHRYYEQRRWRYER